MTLLGETTIQPVNNLESDSISWRHYADKNVLANPESLLCDYGMRWIFQSGRIKKFTGWNWKCHVIIVIEIDLSWFVVTMHSGKYEQYVKSLGQTASEFYFLFRARPRALRLFACASAIKQLFVSGLPLFYWISGSFRFYRMIRPPFKYPMTRLITGSREVSKPRQW